MMPSSRFPLTPRVLGSTGLLVHPLCIGTAALGNMPDTFAYSVAEEQGLATLRAFFTGSINFLDTAASYGDGEAERRIGLALRERGGVVPTGFVLATKADRDLATGDFSGEQIKRSVERSLRLLGLDYLPLVYLHDPEHTTFEQVMAPKGPLATLMQFKDEGVIGHLGIAGGPINMMIRYVETGMFAVAISHNRYTLLNTSAEPLWAAAERMGVAAINAAPYGSGILARGPDSYARYAYQEASDDIIQRTRQIVAICARYAVPLPAAALQYSLRHPTIMSTIVGVSSPDRLTETMTYATHPIPTALWEELATIPADTADPEEHRFSAVGS